MRLQRKGDRLLEMLAVTGAATLAATGAATGGE